MSLPVLLYLLLPVFPILLKTPQHSLLSSVLYHSYCILLLHSIYTVRLLPFLHSYVFRSLFPHLLNILCSYRLHCPVHLLCQGFLHFPLFPLSLHLLLLLLLQDYCYMLFSLSLYPHYWSNIPPHFLLSVCLLLLLL